MNNMHLLHQAVTLYVDANGVFPPMQSPEALRSALARTYFKEDPLDTNNRWSVFVDPKTREPFIPNPALSGRKMSELKHRSQTVVLMHPHQPDSSEGRVVALYLDGKVQLVRWSEFSWMPPADQRPARRSLSSAVLAGNRQ